MTFPHNQAITARPNVLVDQTVPNTLSGVSDPGAAAPRSVPAGESVVRVGAVLSVVALGLLAVLARFG
jgi:hypothetical protein